MATHDITAALGEAFLAAQGLGDGFVREIHPRDEMLLDARGHGDAPVPRERFLYHRAGLEALLSLDNVLACDGRRLEEVGSVLEFASGFGRLTRHLVRRIDPSRVWTCDILPDAAAFMQRTFGVHALPSAMEPADLHLPRRFDVIWVGSLFSHLPRRRFGPWLARLHDALTDGGLLLFSTHGADVVAEVPKSAEGFTFVPHSESRSLSTADYGSTFVRPDVVRSIAAAHGVRHLAGVEHELWWIQDLWAASRDEHPGLARWAATPLVRGRIERLDVATPRRAGIGGWALTAQAISPLRSVHVFVDGRDAGAAVLGDGVPTRAGVERRDGYVHTDWHLQGDIHALPPGPHTLAVVGTASAGAAQCFDVASFETPPVATSR